jgi:hypothetical protein
MNDLLLQNRYNRKKKKKKKKGDFVFVKIYNQFLKILCQLDIFM